MLRDLLLLSFQALDQLDIGLPSFFSGLPLQLRPGVLIRAAYEIKPTWAFPADVTFAALFVQGIQLEQHIVARFPGQGLDFLLCLFERGHTPNCTRSNPLADPAAPEGSTGQRAHRCPVHLRGADPKARTPAGGGGAEDAEKVVVFGDRMKRGARSL